MDRAARKRNYDYESSEGATSQSDYTAPPSKKNIPNKRCPKTTDPEKGSALDYKYEDMFYPMKGNSQGIIIVNQTFPNKDDYREGAEKDVKHLKEIYDELNIDYSPKPWCENVQNVWHNLKSNQMEKRVKTFSKNIIKSCPAIFVSISSHGKDNGEIEGSDGKYIHISKLIECFKTKELLGKPKIFLIQACKGGKEDKRKYARDGLRSSTLSTVEYCTRQADILVAYSTSEGFAAFRCTENGSWFIEVLRDILLDAQYNSWQLTEILAMCTNHIINHYPKKEYDKLTSQTPSYQSTLRKFLRFDEKHRNMYYPMEGIGQGIIIVNDKFDDGKDRKGTKDVEHLRAIYDHLNVSYSKTLLLNIGKHEITECLNNFVNNIQKPCPFILVSVSSRESYNEELLGSDGGIIRVSEIIRYFNTEKLSGIPKVFIIQGSKGESDEKSQIADDNRESSASVQYCMKQSDVIISYSNSEGCLSYTDTKKGSWFIEVFRDCLLDPTYNDKSLIDIFTLCTIRIVNQDKKEKEYSDQRLTQTPLFSSTLTKLLRFDTKSTV